MTRSPRGVLASLPLIALLLPSLGATTVPSDAAREIVQAERAFADSVRSLGMRDGFLAWLAPTGVLFKPGPVIGIEHHHKQPAGWSGLLTWWPVRAAISADGKLGWSTGPWAFRRDSTQRQPDANGQYLTVWRRQANGSWKVILDGGVSHPTPTIADPSLTYSNPASTPGLGSQPLAARKSLYQADASFARVAASEGVPVAISRYGADDLITLREGTRRMSGRADAQSALAGSEKRATLMSTAQHIAASGDLGYTYGTWVMGDAAAPDSCWYVHVWHRSPAATWRLAAELVMPMPKSK